MYKNTILDADDYRRKKINFWFIWTIGNALGTGIGWALGETIGHFVFGLAGLRISLLVADLVFEISVWLPRLWISRQHKELNLFGFIEMIVWLTTEVVMWMIVFFLASPEDTNMFTLGAGLALAMGAAMSVLLSMIGMTRVQLRKSNKTTRPTNGWILKTFLITLFGLMGLNILFMTIMTMSTEVGRLFQELGPIIKWVLSGLMLGGGIGAITGFEYARLISNQSKELF